MHKFEDIMGKSNYEAFKLLVKAARDKKLVCFVGAGLSLYSKRWGEPFEVMVDELIEYAEDLNSNYDIDRLRAHLHELYLIRYRLNRIKANGNSTELRKATTTLRKFYPDVKDEDIKEYEKLKLYPEIGDKIEDIITDSNLRIVESLGVNTFNDWFRDAINKIKKRKCDDIDNKEIHLSGNPYSFSSIYFLPYLGEKVIYITTNCDTSFEDIGENLHIHEYDEHLDANWAKNCPTEVLDEWFMDSNTNRIFYIHGHISKPDTLIMTQRAYQKAYEDDAVAPGINKDAVFHYSLLFLGVSLDSDKTVDVINQQLSIGRSFGKHCIPVFPFASIRAECKLDKKASITLGDDYNDIPVILHQLIREIRTKDDAIYSWKQDLNYKKRNIDQKLAEKIKRFLEGDQSFKKKEFDETQRDDILSFLYNQFLYDSPRNGCPEWTLCQIHDSSFQFNEAHKNGPLHNYPLGNTIYILGGLEKDSSGKPFMDNEHVENISNEIKRWINKEYPNFDDDERFSELEWKKSGPLKVRIITFQSPPSELSTYKEEINRLQCENEDFNCEKKEIQEKLAAIWNSLYKKTHSLDINRIPEMKQLSQLMKKQSKIDVQRLEWSCKSIEEDINDISLLVELLFEIVQGQQHKTKESSDMENQNINEDISTFSLILEPGTDLRGDAK